MQTYQVKSRTNPKKEYTVRIFSDEKAACTCPDFAFGKRGYECAHIKKKRGNVALPEPPMPEEPSDTKKSTIKIKTGKQYKEVEAKVDKLAKEIGDDWFLKKIVKELDEKTGKEVMVEKVIQNEKFKKQIEEHEELAQSLLDYDIEHDKLPI